MSALAISPRLRVCSAWPARRTAAFDGGSTLARAAALPLDAPRRLTPRPGARTKRAEHARRRWQARARIPGSRALSRRSRRRKHDGVVPAARRALGLPRAASVRVTERLPRRGAARCIACMTHRVDVRGRGSGALQHPRLQRAGVRDVGRGKITHAIERSWRHVACLGRWSGTRGQRARWQVGPHGSGIAPRRCAVLGAAGTRSGLTAAASRSLRCWARGTRANTRGRTQSGRTGRRRRRRLDSRGHGRRRRQLGVGRRGE